MISTMIATRSVTEHDRATFEQLYANYLAELDPDNPHPPARWLENVFSQALAGQRCLWLVSYEAEIIGFADFKVSPFFPGSADEFAFVHDFYVAHAWRRRGFGQALARCIVTEAQRRGVSSVELNVAPHNANAMQFWQSVGFKLRHYSLEMSVRET